MVFEPSIPFFLYFFFSLFFLAILASWRFVPFGLIAAFRAADNKGKERAGTRGSAREGYAQKGERRCSGQ